jgi:hypothetical protein
MSKKIQRIQQREQAGTMPSLVDVGCVIHGNTYDWRYVEKLYSMVVRHMPAPVRFHVWTEHDRSVPPHMVKHILDDWPGVSGPKRSWWYKIQMFDPRHHAGDLLYFDLDVVIVGDISWTVAESTRQFWTLRDFRYLQRPTYSSINSSLMWWNVENFSWVWEQFSKEPIDSVIRRYPGDQDFLQATIPVASIRHFDPERVVSWRWQCHDGGWDFQARRPRLPGTGTVIASNASVLVFHGRPKPHEINDAVIQKYWK